MVLFTLTCLHQIHPDQQVLLVFGDRMKAVAPHHRPLEDSKLLGQHEYQKATIYILSPQVMK